MDVSVWRSTLHRRKWCPLTEYGESGGGELLKVKRASALPLRHRGVIESFKREWDDERQNATRTQAAEEASEVNRVSSKTIHNSGAPSCFLLRR
jgi:hypothetical protein